MRWCGPHGLEREAMVVQYVWGWLVLTFDLLLLHYNTPTQPHVWLQPLLSTN